MQSNIEMVLKMRLRHNNYWNKCLSWLYVTQQRCYFHSRYNNLKDAAGLNLVLHLVNVCCDFVFDWVDVYNKGDGINL